jgi:hypothetical protein
MKASVTNHPPIVDASTLGGIIAMTREQVWRLGREKLIPVIKLGRKRHRYDVEAVLQALREQSK